MFDLFASLHKFVCDIETDQISINNIILSHRLTTHHKDFAIGIPSKFSIKLLESDEELIDFSECPKNFSGKISGDSFC